MRAKLFNATDGENVNVHISQSSPVSTLLMAVGSNSSFGQTGATAHARVPTLWVWGHAPPQENFEFSAF